jgi:DNA-binding transcriptional regulator YiaG
MKYKSEIFEVIHQDAIADLEVGAISKAEMEEFDKMCLQKSKTTHGSEKSPKTEYAAVSQSS